MKAIVRTEYGAPDKLRLEEVASPGVEDGKVLVRVRAASVNPLDWHYLRGEPYLMRLSEGFRRPKSASMGVDLAGTVEAVGSGVTQFHPGDEVLGSAPGSLAELSLAREDRLVTKPPSVSFAVASTIACAGVSALQSIRDRGHLEAGQSVLVNGAAGGVGTYAVQLAKAFGAKVTAVCSERNAELVRSIGADDVIDYGREDFARQGRRFDLVLDNVGNRSLADLRRVLDPKGTLVIVGGGTGRWVGPVLLPLRAAALSRFVSQQLRPFLAKITREDLTELAALVEAGKVVPVIDRTYALSETPAAITYLEDGHARGKVVIEL